MHRHPNIKERETMPPENESQGNESKQAEQPSTLPPTDKVDEGSASIPDRRKSPWSTSMTNIDRLTKLSREGLRQRDKISDFLMGLSILIMACLTFVPYYSWQVPMAGLCDLICLATIVWFMVNRLGILSTLTDRQAILIGDIALGIFILATLIFINFVLVFKALQHHPGLS